MADGTVQPAEFELAFDIVNQEATNYDYFFDQFFVEPGISFCYYCLATLNELILKGFPLTKKAQNSRDT